MSCCYLGIKFRISLNVIQLQCSQHICLVLIYALNIYSPKIEQIVAAIATRLRIDLLAIEEPVHDKVHGDLRAIAGRCGCFLCGF